MIPSLKLFSYEPDFNLIMHFFMDNLGESPTVVDSIDPPDPYTDETLWCVLHLRVKKSLLKLFMNDRFKILEMCQRIGIMPDRKDFILKNDSALALIEMHNIFYRLHLKKGGGNIMLLDIENFDVYDFRNNSKLCADLKKIISPNVFNVFGRFEEGDTTMQKTDLFQNQDVENDDTSLDIDEDGELVNGDENAQKGSKAHEKNKADDDSAHKEKSKKKKFSLKQKLEWERMKKKKRQQRLKEERQKELERKKKKVEEDQNQQGALNKKSKKKSEPGFLGKLISCYWCRKQAAKDKKAEKKYQKETGDIHLDMPSQEGNLNTNTQQERDFWIPFSPEKDGANVLFSPQDPELKMLFGDNRPPKADLNQIDLDEELEIPMNKKEAENQRSARQSARQLEQQQQQKQAEKEEEKKSPNNTQQNSPPLRPSTQHHHSHHHHHHHYHRSSHQRHNSHHRRTTKNMASPTTRKEAKILNSGVYSPDFLIERYDECIQELLKDRTPEKFIQTYQHDTQTTKESDLFMFMEGGYNGEKFIHIKLQNKTIILAPDFIQDVVAYSMKPFNGSEHVPYWRELDFNNFAPMRVKVSLTNTSVLLLEDYTTLYTQKEYNHNNNIFMDFRNNREIDANEHRKNCALLAVNIEFEYKTLGDANVGPGSVSMSTDVTLRKANIMKVDTIFKNRDQKEEIKSSGLQHTDRMDSQLSLIEPFKVVYKTRYQLNEHRVGPKKNYPADYDVELKIVNGRDIKRNFLFAVDHIKTLQKIINNVNAPSAEPIVSDLDDKRNRDKKGDADMKPVQDTVNSTYIIRAPSINLSIFNKMQGIDLLRFRISKFLLKYKEQSVDKSSLSRMKARSTLEIDSFNRRKVSHEPLLEPWQFMCTRIAKDNSKSYVIRNAKAPDFKLNERIENHLHHNSLNINLSTECIETLLEISKLFTGDMREDNPYCIINRTHKPINIRNSKEGNGKGPIFKDPASLDWRFFNTTRKLRHAIESTNNAYIDVEIIDKQNTDSESPDEKGMVPLSGTRAKRHSAIALAKPKDKFADSYFTDRENNQTIKQILCDRLGKTVYQARKASSSSKGNKRNIVNIFFLPGTKKIANDPTALNLISSVVINKSTGMKEVTLRSAIMFKNNLETELTIRLPNRDKAPNDEGSKFTVLPGEKFAFPLEMLGESKVQFATSKALDKMGKTLNELIHENATENNFAQEELLSCDSETELATYKDGYLRYEKDEPYQLQSVEEEFPNFNFCLSCYKRKVNSSIKKKRNQAAEFCWETYLVANPYLYVTNATPRRITVFINGKNVGVIESGKKKAQVNPHADEDKDAIKDDMDFCFMVDEFDQSARRKIFKRIDKKERYALKVKTKDQKSCQYFHMEVVKKSEMCREVTIFCPYLIINQTNLPMSYQEAGFAKKTPSVDPYTKKREKQRKFKDHFQSAPDQHRGSQTELDPNITTNPGATNTGNITMSQSGNQTRQTLIADEKVPIHMFSPTKKVGKLQISLNEHIWSKPFSLQSADGTLSLLESFQEIKKKQQERNNAYLNQFYRAGKQLVARFKGVFLKRNQRRRDISRKKYEFSVKIENGTGIFWRSKIVTFTPRFCFKNETSYPLLVKQWSVEDDDDYRLKLKPKAWDHFHWSDATNCSGVQMSITDPNFSKCTAWSGRFRIDEVNKIFEKNR